MLNKSVERTSIEHSPGRWHGRWRQRTPLAIALSLLLAFTITTLTSNDAHAMSGYIEDLLGDNSDIVLQDHAGPIDVDIQHNDVCGICHASWSGAAARGDFALNWKLWDDNDGDGNESTTLRSRDVFNIGTTISDIYADASAQAPSDAPYYFLGAADKDGDGYIQIYYRTETTGMPLNQKDMDATVDTTGTMNFSSGGTINAAFIEPPNGWDTDDNNASEGNVAWGSNDPTSATQNDTTPPDAVSNFGLSALTAGQLDLTWTAPGDDGATGTAHHYDIRYTTDALVTVFIAACGGAQCLVRDTTDWEDMWDIPDCGVIEQGGKQSLIKGSVGATGTCGGGWNTGTGTPLMRAMYEPAPSAGGSTGETYTLKALGHVTGAYGVDPNTVTDGTLYWVAIRTSDGVLVPTIPSPGTNGPFTSNGATGGFTETGLASVSNIIGVTAGTSGAGPSSYSPTAAINNDTSNDITMSGYGFSAANANKMTLVNSSGVVQYTASSVNNGGAPSNAIGTFDCGIAAGTYTLETTTSGDVTTAAWVNAIVVTDNTCGGGGDTTNVTDGTSPGAKYGNGSETDQAVSAFEIATSAGADTVTAIEVTRAGTGADADVTATLWVDVDGDREYSGGDTLVGTADQAFSSNVATFGSLTESISTTATKYVVSFDVTASPGTDGTHTASVTSITATNSGSNGDNADATLIVDTTDPTTTVFGDAGGYTFGDWETGPQVSITMSANDGSGSGIASGYPEYCTGAACTPTTTYGSAFNSPSSACTAGNTCTEVVGAESLDNATNAETIVYKTVNIDLQGPVSGTFSYVIGSATQCDVTYGASASDPGIGSYDASPYEVVRLQGSDPAADCSTGTSITGGWTATSAQTVNDGSLTEGLPYNYRICYKDSLGNISTKTTQICTPSSGPSTQATAGSSSTSDKDDNGGGSKLAVGTFNMSVTSGGNDTVTSITVTRGGTGVDGDVANVYVYTDVNGDYEWDGSDTIVGTAQTFSGGTATFGSLTETASTTATKYIIVYDITGSPGEGTLTGSVTDIAFSSGNGKIVSDDADGTISVDTTAPTTTVVGDAGGYTFGDWVTGPQVSITMSADDGSGSGVAAGYPEYCVGGACTPTTTYGGAFNSPAVACTVGNTCTDITGAESVDNATNPETPIYKTVNIDLKGPNAGSFSYVVASATQCDVTYGASASDDGIGSYDASPYQVVRLQGSDPAADCSTGATITGGWTATSAQTVNDGGLTEGLPYNYRICYKDSLGNISTKATEICTPAAGATMSIGDGSGTADSYATISDTDVLVGTFTVSVANNGGSPDQFTSVTVDLGAQYANAATVYVHVDAGSNGTFDGEGSIGNAAVSSQTTAVTVPSEAVADSSTNYYLITVTTKGSITDTQTLSADVTALGGTTLSPSDSDGTDGTTVMDSTAPSYAWVTPAAGTDYKDGDAISVDVTITETGSGITNGAACNAEIDGATASFTGTATYSTAGTKCSGTLTLGSPSGLGDGSHNVTVEVADDIGNTTVSSTRSVDIDNTSPGSPTNSAPANASYTSNATPTLDWSDVGDPSGVTYDVEVDNNSGFGSPEYTNSGLGVSTDTSGGLGDGLYYLHARAVDNVGNPAGAWSTSTTFTVDTADPTVSSTDPTHLDTDVLITAVVTYNFANGPIDCATVDNTGIKGTSTFYIEETSGSVWVPATVSSCTDNDAVLTPDSPLTSNTNYTVTLTTVAADQAANNLASNKVITFQSATVTDSLPPVWDTTTGTQAVIDEGTGTTLTVCFNSATDAESPPVSYIVYYNTVAPATDGSFLNAGSSPSAGDSGSCGGGTYTYKADLTSLDGGAKYYITVQARDTAAQQTTNADDFVGIPYDRTLDVPGYNMIGVPGEIGVGTTTTSSIAGDDLTYLRTMGWNGRYQTATTFDEGKGYWLLRRGAETTIDIDGGGGECDDYTCYTPQATDPVEVTISRGWNMVSNPCLSNLTGSNVANPIGSPGYIDIFDSGPMTYKDAVDNTKVRNKIYRWSGGSYTADAPNLYGGDPLQPWKGYWLYVTDAAITKIQYYCGDQ